MERRQCGTSDLMLSALGLGCWAFGGGAYWGEVGQGDVNDVVRRAVELGINYFDTAEVYNEGRSESALGRALLGIPRESVIIGGKVSPGAVQPDVLPRHCEESLARLGTDYLDIYMIHWPITPQSIRHFTSEPIPCPVVEDAFAALLKLREQGKIRHIGVSNFGVPKLEEARAAGAAIAVNQLPYNLLCRAIELEALPYCAARGIGVIGYMALMQGVLAGGFETLDDVPILHRRTRHFDSRKNPAARHGEEGAEPETAGALDTIRSIAAELGLEMAGLAIQWALANPAIGCMLAGSANLAHLERNVLAAERPLPAEAVERLNEATEELLAALGPGFDYYQAAANDRTR